MIIPVKCFTCGKVLANKYRYYQREVQKRKIDKSMEVNKVVYLTKEFMDKTPEGEVLDILQLKKSCCRRHMITHVDIE
jgi:DNA-directed RNA polymerase I, II, and III subunit RPABC5